MYFKFVCVRSFADQFTYASHDLKKPRFCKSQSSLDRASVSMPCMRTRILLPGHMGRPRKSRPSLVVSVRAVCWFQLPSTSSLMLPYVWHWKMAPTCAIAGNSALGWPTWAITDHMALVVDSWDDLMLSWTLYHYAARVSPSAAEKQRLS